MTQNRCKKYQTHYIIPIFYKANRIAYKIMQNFLIISVKSPFQALKSTLLGKITLPFL